MKTNPLRHTGDSANMAHYSEENGPLFATVLCADFERNASGEFVAKRVPDYYVTVYREGHGEVARFKYAPKTKPRGEALPARTVTRLVREELARRGRGSRPSA